jgi:hypothetical protein
MHPNTVMPFARISASNQSIVSFGPKLLGVVVSPSKWLSFIVDVPYLEAPVEATIRCSTTGAIIHKPA